MNKYGAALIEILDSEFDSAANWSKDSTKGRYDKRVWRHNDSSTVCTLRSTQQIHAAQERKRLRRVLQICRRSQMNVVCKFKPGNNTHHLTFIVTHNDNVEPKVMLNKPGEWNGSGFSDVEGMALEVQAREEAQRGRSPTHILVSIIKKHFVSLAVEGPDATGIRIPYRSLSVNPDDNMACTLINVRGSIHHVVMPAYKAVVEEASALGMELEVRTIPLRARGPQNSPLSNVKIKLLKQHRIPVVVTALNAAGIAQSKEKAKRTRNITRQLAAPIGPAIKKYFSSLKERRQPNACYDNRVHYNISKSELDEFDEGSAFKHTLIGVKSQTAKELDAAAGKVLAELSRVGIDAEYRKRILRPTPPATSFSAAVEFTITEAPVSPQAPTPLPKTGKTSSAMENGLPKPITRGTVQVRSVLELRKLDAQIIDAFVSKRLGVTSAQLQKYSKTKPAGHWNSFSYSLVSGFWMPKSKLIKLVQAMAKELRASIYSVSIKYFDHVKRGDHTDVTIVLNIEKRYGSLS